jgi:hypothetical protein
LRNLIGPPSTRIEAIKLFTEISTISLVDEEESVQQQFKEKTLFFFCHFIEQIAIVTKGRDLRQEHTTLLHSKQQGHFEHFAKMVAMAITSTLKQHQSLIEQTCNVSEPNANIEALRNYTQKSLQYLIQMTNIVVDGEWPSELFKICLDFWHFFAYDILQKTQQNLFKD